MEIGPELIQLDGVTFATKQITSVRMQHPNVALRVIGVLLFGFFARVFWPSWGGWLLAFVAVGCALQKSTLFLRTAGGESKAFVSVVPDRVDAVHDAVVRAMAGK